MNPESNIIATIDIGTTKIVAAAGRRMANGQVAVLGLAETESYGLKRGVILNIEETVSGIQKVVQALEQQINTKLTHVFVGVAGQHIRSMQNKAYIHIDPNMEIKQLDVNRLLDDCNKMYADPGYQILHVIPQYYNVDQEIGLKSPVGINGRKLEGAFHVVMASTASVMNVERSISRAGLQLMDLMLEPLASVRSTISMGEKEAGVVLVDIGGGTTDVAVYHDGILRHTAVIPFGGNVITNDIKEGCSVLPKQAESLKIKYGMAIGDMAREDLIITLPALSQGWEAKEIKQRTLSFIIQARMEEIIDFVCREIENSGFWDKLGAGVVLSGGGAMLPLLPDLFKYRSGHDVRLGVPTCSNQSGRSLDHPKYATVVGMLQNGIDSKKMPPAESPKLFDTPEVVKPKEAPASETKKSVKAKKGGGALQAIVEGFSKILSPDDDDQRI